MPLDSIHALVKDDFTAMNDLILYQLQSRVELINQLSQHIIRSGGKRLRPLLVLMSAHACHYKGDQHIWLATIVEFIHTATLLHDDVVDHSKMRRGKKTAHLIWGSEASVLVGDFLYSRSFQMMVALKENCLEIMKMLADASNAIAEGEVLQLANCHNDAISEEEYLQIIYHKTARLFEAATETGAMLSNVSQKEITALKNYGKHLGLAFQLIDDALDYCANENEIGKNVGDDLAQGKPTMPLIYILKTGTSEQQQMIRAAIKAGTLDRLHEITLAIEATGAITHTYELAKQQVDKAIAALNDLEPSVYRDALQQLAQFAIERRF